MAELSPMMQQYFAIKEKHKDHIVFFRLGDFYEMFFDDAVLASKELELTLTGRDCGQEERAPMCGVPYHASEGYIAKSIEKGYKVAICEQTEDPAQAKGIVKRDVVRVVTPGTVIESSMLSDDKNNYIASIYYGKNTIGLCFADISTGAVQVTSLSDDDLNKQLISELYRFMPSEVIFNSEILAHNDITAYIKDRVNCSVELIDDSIYNPFKTEELLKEQFEGAIKQLLKTDESSFALAALVAYLHETQKKGTERLKTIQVYNSSQYMQLSPVTRANLELTETMRGREKRGTLLWVLDKTQTSMGKRLLRTFVEQPLLNVEPINDRLNAVEELFEDHIGRSELQEILAKIFDIERLMTRVVYGSATPREVYALGSTSLQLPALKSLLKQKNSALLKNLYNDCDTLDDIKEKIFCALVENPPVTLKDGGVINAGYNSEVDELRGLVTGGKGKLAEMENRLKDETGIKNIKIGYNKVFGYYIEVTKSYLSQVPDSFIRKQTLANAERYITEEVKDYENKILGANERLVTLEHELFHELLHFLSINLSRIQKTASAVAHIDTLMALADVAAKNNYTRPHVNTADVIDITEGRHPVIEQMTKGQMFVPNDTLLDNHENRLLIITGPNMAGKSTYMRQTALITLMAQIGSFVPAQSATIGIVDSIFTRVGAQDDLSSGKSTFMVEMTEVAEILQNAGPKSLIILDEIGRGTSTFDGMSIAKAVAEYIANKNGSVGCKTMFATHYHELTDLENELDGIKNYNIAVKKRGDDITFLRRIVRGPADDSYGIEVAKLAGVPNEVIQRAKEILKELIQFSAENANVSQLHFGSAALTLQPQETPSELLEALERVDVETLTPIEALNLLYKLKELL